MSCGIGRAHRLAGRTRAGADQEADGTLVKLRARLFAPRVARRNLLFDDELLDGLVGGHCGLSDGARHDVVGARLTCE